MANRVGRPAAAVATAAGAFGLTTAIAAAFLLSFAALAAEPEEALIGYKG